MFWFKGWLLEQISQPVNKVVGLVPVDTPMKVNPAKVDAVNPRHYRSVAKHYFDDGELFDVFDGKRMVELHGENWSYVTGHVKMFYVNILTGHQVMLGYGVPVVYSPEVLEQLRDANDVKSLGKGLLAGLGGDWIKYAIGGVIGAFGAYMVLSLLGMVKIG